MPNRLINFVDELIKHRRTVSELAKNDFRARYLDSYLGITWAFIQPICTILILWFVFEAGFKVGPVQECPFVLWLVCGLLPWNFFADALMNGANSIKEQSYLVKKVVFKVSMLPIVKLISSLFVHLVFIVLLFTLFSLSGRPPSLHALQIPVYLLCTFFLLLGLSWTLSSMVVFIPDLREAINVVLQLGFWMTPIFWNLEMVPERFHFILKLNPMYFVIQGYRDSLINHVWFWQRPELMLYFLGLSAVLFCLGAFSFMKLRPHFADVL